MLDKSVFLARPLESNLTLWFISLTAHNCVAHLEW